MAQEQDFFKIASDTGFDIFRQSGEKVTEAEGIPLFEGGLDVSQIIEQFSPELTEGQFVRFGSGIDVFQQGPGGTLQLVPDEATLLDLGGQEAFSNVTSIQEAFRGGFQFGDDLTPFVPPPEVTTPPGPEMDAEELAGGTAATTSPFVPISSSIQAGSNLNDISTSILASIQKQQEFIQMQSDRLLELQSSLDTKRLEQTEDLDALRKEMDSRKSIADIIQEQFTKYEIPGTLAKINELSDSMLASRQQLGALMAEEQQALFDNRQDTASQTFITGKQAIIQREFDIRRMGLSAQLGAQAAQVEALRGNVETARQLAGDYVNAATFDQQQRISDITSFININSDLISDLSKAEQSTLDTILDGQEAELARQTQEKLDVFNLMLQNPHAFEGRDIGDMSVVDATIAVANFQQREINSERVRQLSADFNAKGAGIVVGVDTVDSAIAKASAVASVEEGLKLDLLRAQIAATGRTGTGSDAGTLLERLLEATGGAGTNITGIVDFLFTLENQEDAIAVIKSLPGALQPAVLTAFGTELSNLPEDKTGLPGFFQDISNFFTGN